MIDVYTWSTPNGYKVQIMLEECGLPYTVQPVNFLEGEQFKPELLVINPNNKIPAIVDQQGPGEEPITVFESSAILVYLAEKVGKFMPAARTRSRYEVMQWLMFQTSSIGPIFEQAYHFSNVAKEQVVYAMERYSQEVQHLCKVMDKRLMAFAYIAGGQYTIADIALFPWMLALERFGENWDWGDYPYLKNWCDTVAVRPAVQKGLQI